MIKPILQQTDPILKEISKEIHLATQNLDSVKIDMIDTLKNNKYGIALSAIQIGIPYRIFLIYRKDNTENPYEFYINPICKPLGSKLESKYESCLSVENNLLFAEVERSYAIRVDYTDETGIFISKKFDGLAARIIQHEMDHLDGKLFTDIANPSTKKNLQEYLDLIKKRS